MKFKSFINFSLIVLKLSSVITVVSYLFGFIIVNVYLSDNGFYDFSFFQPRYLATGVLFLIFASIFLCFYFVFKGIGTKLKLIGIVTTITLFLMCLFIIYPKLIFPKIPFAYGGGSPICVALLFNDSANDIVPIKTTVKNQTMYLISKLLYQTNDYLAFQTDRGFFLVYRDKIKSIYYPGNTCDFTQIGKGLIFVQ